MPASPRWLVLGTATLAQAGASFLVQGLGAVMVFLQQAFALSGAEVGLVVTAVAVAPIVAMVGVGDLLDRFPDRVVVAAGALVTGLGAAIAAAAHSYVLLLAGLAVAGLGYSTAQPSGSKAIAAWFPDRRRGLAMGVRQAGLPIGGAAAAAALPAVAQTWGWRATFVLAAAVVLTTGLLFAATNRAPLVRPTSRGRLAGRLRDVVGQPWFRPVIVAGATLVTAQFAVQTYLMLFLHRAHGLTVAHAGAALVVAQASGVAGRILLGRHSDHVRGSRLRPVVVCMLVTAGTAAVLPLLPPATPTPVLFLLAAVLGVFGYGWYGPWITHVAETAAPATSGLAIGTAMATNQIAIAATPPLLGLLYDLSGSYTTIWWPPAVLLLLAVPLVRHS